MRELLDSAASLPWRDCERLLLLLPPMRIPKKRGMGDLRQK
ncbi:hypothetical protein [Acidovorax sp. PRC11]|nr:hypothetical protein [Acidovorax sp. PRC11]MDT0138776.1 hypothetical protein [Acidovorax sp. PRC11]